MTSVSDERHPRGLKPWLAAAIPDFLFGALFLTAWIGPGLFPGWMLRWMFAGIAIEFTVLAATAVLAGVALLRLPLLVRILCIIGLTPAIIVAFLFLMVWSGVEEDWWLPVVSFILVASRAVPLLSGTETRHDRIAVSAYTVLSAAAFIISFLIAFYVPMPAFGITEKLAAGLNVEMYGQPAGYFAWGVLFFPISGVAAIGANTIANRIEPRG